MHIRQFRYISGVVEFLEVCIEIYTYSVDRQIIFEYQNVLQYELSNFQRRDTNLERFLSKNELLGN